jgi:hypothetical protein
MATTLVAQLAMYHEPDSLEQAFALRAIGAATARLGAGANQLILDHLSAVYLAAVGGSERTETAAAAAFGAVAAGGHLRLVMTKLEAVYRGQQKKKSATMFFGLLRDRTGEEQQVRWCRNQYPVCFIFLEFPNIMLKFKVIVLILLFRMLRV